METADRWEDYSDFVGPRIAPGLRWRRMIEREAEEFYQRVRAQTKDPKDGRYE